MPSVQTAYGRSGPHVSAEPGDYAASQVTNDSEAPGETLAEATSLLADELAARVVVAADLGGTPQEPLVARIQGRAVLDVEPVDGDRLTWVAENNRWEPKPASARSTFWTDLYEYDLRDAPLTALLGPSGYQSYVLDGVRWGWHNGGGSSGSSIEPGTGAQMIANGRQLPAAQNAYAGLRLCLVVNELPGYDDAQDTVTMVRFSGTFSGSKECGATVWTGGEGWGYGPGTNNASVYLYNPTFDKLRMRWVTPSNLDWNTAIYFPTFTGDDALAEEWVFATRISGASKRIRQGYILKWPLANGWPAVEEMMPCGFYESPDAALSPVQMGFAVGTASGFGSFSATDIKVLQKPASPL